MAWFVVGIACLAMALPTSIEAQVAAAPAEQTALRGKHRFEIGIGLLSEVNASSQTSVGGVTTQSDAEGLVGSIAYTYFFARDFGIEVGAGVLDADAKVSASGSEWLVESASVVPLLFGLKYEPSRLTLGNLLSPYASVAIGPHFGSASHVQAGVTTFTESSSETTLGSRLRIGMDVLLGKWFTLGVAAGYHLVSDFDTRIGSDKNYSSPEFTLLLGVSFGGSS